MKNKKTKLIFLVIILFVVILFSIIIVSYKNGDSKEWLETKTAYNAKNMESQFIQTAKDIESRIAMNIFESDIVNDKDLASKVKSMNRILEGNNWEKINSSRPELWQGTWYLNTEARLKFKFTRKEIEPKWINNIAVREYIVKN